MKPTLPRWYIVQYRHRPTFYLDGWLLGIVSAEHAARIAADVLGIDTSDPSQRNAPAVVAYVAEDTPTD